MVLVAFLKLARLPASVCMLAISWLLRLILLDLQLKFEDRNDPQKQQKVGCFVCICRIMNCTVVLPTMMTLPLVPILVFFAVASNHCSNCPHDPIYLRIRWSMICWWKQSSSVQGLENGGHYQIGFLLGCRVMWWTGLPGTQQLLACLFLAKGTAEYTSCKYPVPPKCMNCLSTCSPEDQRDPLKFSHVGISWKWIWVYTSFQICLYVLDKFHRS